MNTQKPLAALPRVTLVILLGIQTLSAATFGEFTYKDEGATITITHYTRAAAGTVIIPATIAGKPVTAIGESAFNSCKALEEVILPDSITSIGEYAFDHCGLTRISIPKSVTSIGPWAFSYCTNLPEVTIPGSVSTLGIGAFGFCDKLSTVSLSEGLTSIGGQAFYSCGSLKSITLPDSLVSIGYNAFDACGLTRITIPRNVTSIASNAFYACKGMTEITVDERSRSYWSEDGVLFDRCQTAIIEYPCGKSGSYAIGEGVTTIKDRAFLSCDGLTSVTVPASVISIVPSDFRGCNNLRAIHVEAQNPLYSSDKGVLYDKQKTKLLTFPGGKSGTYYIPSGVTTIESCAFLMCQNLERVFIPASVTEIGAKAFNSCSSLNNAVFYGNAPEMGPEVFNWCANTCWIEHLAGSTGFDAPAWQYYMQRDFHPIPQIKVKLPGAKNLRNGVAEKAFGETTARTGRTQMFTIKNTGTGLLNHIAITKTGGQHDFIVTPPASNSLAPGEFTLFSVTFMPGATGKYQASIHIKSNDPDQSPFDIKLTGIGTTP